MKNSVFILCIFLLAAACKKDNGGNPQPGNNDNGLKGGKGGDYSIIIFTKINQSGADARLYLKYAADKAPVDTAQYNEISNTMTEPGYGHHAHFNFLQKGTYYFHAKSNKNTLQADTVITIADSTASALELTLYLK